MNSIYEMVEYGKSKYPSIIRGLDEFQVFDTDQEKLLNLELYNIVDRKEIIDMFCEMDIPYTYCAKETKCDFLEEYYHKIRSNGFFVQFADEDTRKVTLVIDRYYPEINENIIIALRGCYVEIKYVTPLNYRILCDGLDYTMENVIPVIYFKRIVYDAFEKKCSDIHILNNRNRTGGFDYVLRYRILNPIVTQNSFHLTASLVDKMISDVIGNYTMAELTDLDSSYGVETSWMDIMGDNSGDLRITCSKSPGGYTMVCRIQRMSTISKNIKTLGFSEKIQKDLTELSERTTGLTLITGAPRTGKNTTMIAMINEQKDKPIVRMEYSSPIEVIMPHVQLDYNSNADTLLNFVKLAKKQDIDLVIMNELPDSRLATPIIDLVNSSIGVITTFHINRLWNAPLKMKSYFGKDYVDLITQLNGIVNQKMFVKQCTRCSREKSHRNFSNFVLSIMDGYNIKTFYESEGCPECGGTGRVNIVQPYAESLIFTTEIKDKLIECDKPHEMEKILKEECYKLKSNMEVEIVKAIKLGELSPIDLEILQ